MNYVISIIAPTAEEKLVGICAELEIPLSVVLRGRGTAVQSMLELLGIESCERRIFMALADGEKSRRRSFTSVCRGTGSRLRCR